MKRDAIIPLIPINMKLCSLCLFRGGMEKLSLFFHRYRRADFQWDEWFGWLSVSLFIGTITRFIGTEVLGYVQYVRTFVTGSCWHLLFISWRGCE